MEPTAGVRGSAALRQESVTVTLDTPVTSATSPAMEGTLNRATYMGHALAPPRPEYPTSLEPGRARAMPTKPMATSQELSAQTVFHPTQDQTV